MNIKLKTLLLSLLFVAFSFVPVYADHNCREPINSESFEAYTECMNTDHSATDSTTTQEASTLEGPDSEAGLKDSNQMQNSGSIQDNPIVTRLAEVIDFLAMGVGIVITISVVVAGIQYTTSNGDPQKTQKAVSRLISAGIALFLFIFGYAILQWIIPGGTLNTDDVNQTNQTQQNDGDGGLQVR